MSDFPHQAREQFLGGAREVFACLCELALERMTARLPLSEYLVDLKPDETLILELDANATRDDCRRVAFQMALGELWNVTADGVDGVRLLAIIRTIAYSRPGRLEGDLAQGWFEGVEPVLLNFASLLVQSFNTQSFASSIIFPIDEMLEVRNTATPPSADWEAGQVWALREITAAFKTAQPPFELAQLMVWFEEDIKTMPSPPERARHVGD